MWIILSVLIFGGTAYFSGWVINLYFKTGWIPIVLCILGGFIGLLLHGIPEDNDGN